MELRQVRRVGLIGIGKHGARYARHIREDLPDLELAAVARRDPVKAAATARDLGATLITRDRLLLKYGKDGQVSTIPC